MNPSARYLGEPSTVKNAILYWIPVVGWMAAIFLLSNSTASTIEGAAAEVRGFAAILPAWMLNILTSPSFVHPVEFGVLAALLYRLLNSFKPLSLRYIIAGSLVLAIGYGLLDEFHQSFVPGRSSSLRDVAHDALGVSIGLGVALLWRNATGRTGWGWQRDKGKKRRLVAEASPVRSRLNV